ncbi:MAG TPA: DUF2142 domain-containing protein [Thermoleophilaceae bacterium]
MTRGSRVRDALFPGDRRVWLVAAGLGAFFLIGIAVALLVPRDYYTGTSSVRLRSFPIELARGQQLCVPQRLPSGTGRVELMVDTAGKPRPPIAPLVIPRAGTPIPGRVITPTTAGTHKIQIEIPPLPETPETVPGAVCLRSAGKLFVGGMHIAGEFDRPPPTVDGKPVPSRIAVWFRPPSGEKKAVAAMLPDIVRRAALFRPGIVGPWTYVAILFLVFPGLIYAGLRLLARSGEEHRRRVPVALAVALIALGHAACWALVTPVLDAPDETEHFAYAQRVAETGKGLTNSPQLYSSDTGRLVDATRVLAHNETGDGRPPWLQEQEDEWKEADRRERRPTDDGGGVATATSSHSPVYYGTLAPTYLAVKGGSAATQVTSLRITSALYGALAAACAFLLVAELVPRRRLVAVAAGLLVAFHPMFAFMSGAVNNDMGVNAMSALLLFLVVRAYVRGLSPGLAVAIGALLIVAPLMKGTAYALYPAAVVGVGASLWRHHPRRAWVSAAALGVTAIALFLAWSALSGHFEREAFTTPGGTAPGSNFGGVQNPRGLLAYLWQIFFPPLPFMIDYWQQGHYPYYFLYVVRAWGSFGWYAMTFSDWVYWVIAIVQPVVAIGAVAALVRYRHRLRQLAVPALVIMLAIGGILGGVHAFYFPVTPRADTIPEQGRYLFPAIAGIAAIVVCAAYAFGRRYVTQLATAFVVAVMGLAYAAQFMVLTRWFT